MKRSLHALKNWRKKFQSSMNVLRMTFKMSLVLLHHNETPIQVWCKQCLTTSRYLGQVAESSTKALKRKERSVSGAIHYEVKRREQKRPNQYAKLLRNSENKMSLVKFLLNDWKKNRPTVFKEKKFMQSLTIKVSAYLRTMIQFKWTSYVTQVQTKNKDDTKVCLCTKNYMLLDASSFCIETVDKDVLVLSFYYHAHLNNHFLTFNLPLHINMLGKSEEHFLNVSYADYENSIFVELFLDCMQ